MSKLKKILSTKKQSRPRQTRNIKSLNSLEFGDTIEIIAPASYTPVEQLLKGAELLRSWGFKVIYEQDILKPHLFLAQTDEYRFKQFKKAMTNKKSKVVWCLRGGYGSIRLLPLIEKMEAPKIPKILIGLSDISSLQALIVNKWNFVTLHGSLVDRLISERMSKENSLELKRALMDDQFDMYFNQLKPLNKKSLNKKIINSKITGGNLTVVTSTLGTKSQLKTMNKIIFLEELSERGYRIDRCLQQMKQAGLFDKAQAVIFGDFTNCDEPNGQNYVQQVLKEFCSQLSIPAFSGIENGHDDLQRPLYFNTSTKLICGPKPQMTVYSPFRKA